MQTYKSAEITHKSFKTSDRETHFDYYLGLAEIQQQILIEQGNSSLVRLIFEIHGPFNALQRREWYVVSIFSADGMGLREFKTKYYI